MFNAEPYWISVAEVQQFSKDAIRVFSQDEWDALIECLSMNPVYGEVIPDTNGVRMLEWPAESQGRGGFVRVLYFFGDLNIPLFLVAIYERGEVLNLSSADKQTIRLLVEELVASYFGAGRSSMSLPGGAA